ncbi:hypothetical protein [Phorcysia thermohydrogeniphila]|uniref:Uncharacterized protein n=1 Tax=Phorcysia thermohydrogeniphila TaxID=936138 RepID=A0A4R1GEL6_9BACT|nr:hypothetical protein [Phorcysia thermohydrogeniphila]TCK05250.1 hypothetical protein CLV27_0676 [Phorcysia thermohydrogeniphila]
MAISLNQDIRAGKSTYHVQTEYYKTSNKIISNIFKDGKAVKRLEKEVEEGRDLDEQIKEFHNSIIERLTKPTLVKRKKKEEKPVQEAQKEVFTLTEQQEEKIAAVIYPFFGIATYLVISDAASNASSKEEFVDQLLGELEEEKAKEVREEILSILSEKVEEKPSELKEEKKTLPFPEEELTEILFPYFGIMTGVLVESAKRVWDGEKGKLLDFLAGELDDDVREEVLKKVSSLLGEVEESTVEVEKKEEKVETPKEENLPTGRKLDSSEVDKVLPVLQEYFGISAAMVAEDAFEESGGEVNRFVEIILSEVDENEREELEIKLRGLLGGS